MCLRPGDIVVFCSDGVHEHMNALEEKFGIECLIITTRYTDALRILDLDPPRIAFLAEVTGILPLSWSTLQASNMQSYSRSSRSHFFRVWTIETPLSV